MNNNINNHNSDPNDTNEIIKLSVNNVVKNLASLATSKIQKEIDKDKNICKVNLDDVYQKKKLMRSKSMKNKKIRDKKIRDKLESKRKQKEIYEEEGKQKERYEEEGKYEDEDEDEGKYEGDEGDEGENKEGEDEGEEKGEEKGEEGEENEEEGEENEEEGEENEEENEEGEELIDDKLKKEIQKRIQKKIIESAEGTYVGDILKKRQDLDNLINQNRELYEQGKKILFNDEDIKKINKIEDLVISPDMSKKNKKITKETTKKLTKEISSKKINESPKTIPKPKLKPKSKTIPKPDISSKKVRKTKKIPKMDYSKIKSVTSGLKFEKKGIGSTYGKFIKRTVISTVKVSASIGAIVVTSGGGGDVIVSAMSAVIDSANFLNSLTTTLNEINTFMGSSYQQYIKELLDIRFENGPEGVRESTKELLKKMADNGDLELIQPISEVFNDIYSSLCTVFSDWIATFIPDGGLIIGQMLSAVINTPSTTTYFSLLKMYNLLPSVAQETLQSSAKLKQFFVNILKYLRFALTGEGGFVKEKRSNKEILNDPNLTDEEKHNIIDEKKREIEKEKEEKKKAKSSFAYRMFTVLKPDFGVLQLTGVDKLLYNHILNMVEKVYNPAIDKAVEVVKIIFPLLFAILVINECYLLCKI